MTNLDFDDEEDRQIGELAYEILGINYFDLKNLNIYCQAGKKFNKDFVDEVVELYKELDVEDLQEKLIKEINGLMFSTLSRLFDYISNGVIQEEPELEKAVETLNDEFDPYVEGGNGSFQNVFDDLDFDKDTDEIIKQAVDLIKESIEEEKEEEDEK